MLLYYSMHRYINTILLFDSFSFLNYNFSIKLVLDISNFLYFHTDFLFDLLLTDIKISY